MPTPNQSKTAVKVFTEASVLLWFRVVGMGPCSQASHAGSQHRGREMGASSAGLARREELRSAGQQLAQTNVARFEPARVSPWDRFTCNVRNHNCVGAST